jgi:hypothetical protein
MAAEEIPASGYPSRLLNKVEVAEGTMAFHFEKPPGFDFKPGQSADLTLLNPPETDSEGNVRTFSIASAPFEDQLMFATRMRDTAFKRSLKKMPLGAVVKMDSAMGSFTLHRIPLNRPCSLPVESELHRFPASYGRPTMTGRHTTCTSFILTGGPKTRPSWRPCRISKRQIHSSVAFPQ